MAWFLAASEEPGVNHLVQERLAQRLRVAFEVLARELDQRRLVRDPSREVAETRVERDAMRRNLAAEELIVQPSEQQLKLRLIGQHGAEALHPRERTFLPVNQGPARGLPPRISLPVSLLATALLVAIVFSFIKSSLTVTGAAFGPTAKTNGESAMTVGGGSAGVAVEDAPPAPIQRMLTEFKTRLARDPNDRTALLGLAEMYAQAGKYGAALPYYRRVLARQPLDAATRLAYADALRRASLR